MCRLEIDRKRKRLEWATLSVCRYIHFHPCGNESHSMHEHDRSEVGAAAEGKNYTYAPLAKDNRINHD